MQPGRLTALRCRSQLLSGPPARTPVEVARQLLAVQAQDPRGFRLAVRSRTSEGHVAELERSLTDDRSLVVSTLNRGTLHLVRADDYWWLHALTTPPLHTANARRLAQTGVSADQAERGVGIVTAALTADGPLTREQLRSRLESADVPTAGQALVHVLLEATLRGLIVRGPIAGGQQAWVPVRDWLGRPPPFDRQRALAELARRYLAGHAPATDRDLAKWSGLPLRDARAGLRSIADQLHDLGGGLNSLRGGQNQSRGDRAQPITNPAPRLLGPFDPLLLGWEDRRPIVGDNPTLVTSNGLFRPFALVGGRAVATWGLAGGTLTVRPFSPLSTTTTRALATEVAAIGHYLGFGTDLTLEIATTS